MDITNGIANDHYHRHQGVKRGKHIAKTRRERRALKVVYISSPMKVKTCASKFRALVQELTGKESDVVRLMETTHVDHHQEFKNVDDFYTNDDSRAVLTYSGVLPSVPDGGDSETKLFEPFDDHVFASQVMNDSFTRSSMFPSDWFYESYSQTDCLRSFDALG